MKKSEQYWNAACDLTNGCIDADRYIALRNQSGIGQYDMSYWLGHFYPNTPQFDRAFFFFMVAEEHRIHGD